MATFDSTCFSGKTAVITGGSGALCSAIAEYLARLGCQVALVNRGAERALGVVERIRAAGGVASAHVGDVTQRASLEAAAAGVMERYGRIDFLVNGAGGFVAGSTAGEVSFFDLPETALLGSLDLNLVGAMRACQAFGRQMIERGGSIVNISSAAAERPLTRVVAYGAAKAGLNNFTRWLAAYMAQSYSALIRVNAIAPGFVLTSGNRGLLVDAATGELSERGKRVVAHTPMGRLGTPDDLVGAVAWLLSDAASYVTGAIIPVDGGFSAFAGV